MSSVSYKSELDVGTLLLEAANEKLKVPDFRFDANVIDGELERTVSGASTLTLVVHDPRRVFLHSKMLDWEAEIGPGGEAQVAVDLRFDGLDWRLVKAEKAGNDLTLTFEDAVVAKLRLETSPKKATRGKVTRAEFAHSLVSDASASIPFYSPDEHLEVAVEKIKPKKEKKKDDDAAPGFHLQQALEMRDVSGGTYPAEVSQVRLAQKVLDIAASLKAPRKAAKALIEAGMVESQLRNLAHGHSTSLGFLQVLDSTAKGLRLNPRDVEDCAHVFLTKGFRTDPVLGGGGAIGIARRWPGVSAGAIAQACQGSAYPDRYDAMNKQAEEFLKAYYGDGAHGSVESDRSIEKKLPYQFTRGGEDGEIENSWDALQRLAEEVQWRCFVTKGVVYFVADDTLLRAKPIMRVNERSAGIVGIDFDCDTGKYEQTATVMARAARWLAGPGQVVELYDMGPANGRWIVNSLRRPVFDPAVEIQLSRASTPLKEPAPETETVTEEEQAGGPFGSLAAKQSSYAKGSSWAKCWDKAWEIHNKHMPYIWGGGHSRAGVPDGGTGRDKGIGYDCSGSTSAVLEAGGVLDSGPMTSGNFAYNWGAPGKGEHLTVWANSTHVFIVFHKATSPDSNNHFGTGDWGKGWDGAGFNPRHHPFDDFVPRCVPGDERSVGEMTERLGD